MPLPFRHDPVDDHPNRIAGRVLGLIRSQLFREPPAKIQADRACRRLRGLELWNRSGTRQRKLVRQYLDESPRRECVQVDRGEPNDQSLGADDALQQIGRKVTPAVLWTS